MARVTLGSGRQNFRFERNGESDRITDFKSTYFEASLDEAQEAPPNDDIAGIDGTGTGVLDFARERFEFSLDIDGINLDGGPADDDMTDMHIHDGAPGEAGPIIFHFLEDAETVVDASAGTVTGGWDVNEADAEAEDMTAPNVAALLAGDTYFNIHTNRDSSGFIRGQILKDGGAGDRIDLRELNIGSFETLQAITRNASGDAVIRAFFDGEASSLRLDGVGKGDLKAGHFIFAGNVSETVNGNAGRDDLFGAGGGDTVRGRGGDDRLFGENGNDTLSGAGGRDQCFGGFGRDLLTGGAAADRFVFAGVAETADTGATADRISDFVANRDDIVLAAIDARAGQAGNQAFTFIGDDAFDAAGQVRVRQSGGDTFVSLNVRGQDGAEAVIRLDGEIPFTEVDLIL